MYTFQRYAMFEVDQSIGNRKTMVMLVWFRYTYHRESFTVAVNKWCGRKVMRLATLCTSRQRCCLPLHMAVRLTPAIGSVQV